jgi:uncharacterized protein YhaN
MTEEKKVTEEATESVADQQIDDVIDAAEIMEETTEIETAEEAMTEEESSIEEEPAAEEIASTPLPTGARICVALSALLGTAIITHIIMTVVSLIAG